MGLKIPRSPKNRNLPRVPTATGGGVNALPPGWHWVHPGGMFISWYVPGSTDESSLLANKCGWPLSASSVSTLAPTAACSGIPAREDEGGGGGCGQLCGKFCGGARCGGAGINSCGGGGGLDAGAWLLLDAGARLLLDATSPTADVGGTTGRHVIDWPASVKCDG